MIQVLSRWLLRGSTAIYCVKFSDNMGREYDTRDSVLDCGCCKVDCSGGGNRAGYYWCFLVVVLA